MDRVENAERKSFRQHTVFAPLLPVHARVELEGVDFGEKRIEKVVADARFLPFVKAMALREIVLSCAENLDFH